MGKKQLLPRVFYGWVVVGVSVVILTLIGGSQYSFGVFFKPLVAEFGWTRAATSLARSIVQAIHGLLNPLVGLTSDRWGPRILIVVCGVGVGIGFALMSRVTELWQLYLYYGVIIGVFTSFAWVPLTSIVTRWFAVNRGLVVGITATGVGLGSVVMAPLAQALISSFSWRMSFLIIGCLAVSIITPLSIFLKSPGLDRNALRHYDGKTEDGSKVIEAHSRPSLNPSQAWRTKCFWLLGAMHFVNLACTQMVMVHIVPHATDQGIPPMPAAAILSLIGMSSIIGRVSFGFISDRIGGKQSLLITLLVLFVAMFALLWVKELRFFYPFAIVFGLGYGGLVPIFPVIIGDYFGLRHQGAIFGANLFFACFGGALGPFFAGYVYDTTGEYSLAFLVVAIALLMAALMTSLLRPPEQQRR